MSNEKPHTPLGERFREWEQGPAGAGDQPGAQVWEGIAAAIAPPERRRRFFWWWWLGAGLACIALGGWLHLTTPTALNAFPVPLPAGHEQAPAINGTVSGPPVVSGPQSGSPQPATDKTAGSLLRDETEVTGNPRRALAELPAPVARPQSALPSAASLPEDRAASATRPRMPVTVPPAVATAGLRLLPVSDPALPALRSFAAPAKPRLTVGVYYAPVLTETRVRGTGRALLGARERSRYSDEWGIMAHLTLGGNWSIGGGIGRSEVDTEQRFRFIRRVTPQREMPTGNGQQQSTFALDLSSPYAKSQAEVEVVRSDDDPLPAQPILILVQLRERVTFTHLPVLAGYEQQWGNWLLRVATGPELSLSNTSRTDARARILRGDQFRARPLRVLTEQPTVREVALNWTSNAGIYYQLDDHLQVGLSPQLRLGLSAWEAGQDARARLHQFGLRLEGRYRF